MKAGLVIIAILAVLAIGLGGWVVGNYNGLVGKKADVDKQYAQVDNELQRRNDLVPNLVNTVKGVAAQEQIVFGRIADARAAMLSARTPEQRLAAGSQMDGVIGRLLAIAEAYPQLRSSDAFLKLQDQLEGTENRLAVERMRYNEVVRDYNVMVTRFPTNIFAGMFNYKAAPFYPVAPEARQAPKVEFPSAAPVPGAMPESAAAH